MKNKYKVNRSYDGFPDRFVNGVEVAFNTSDGMLCHMCAAGNIHKCDDPSSWFHVTGHTSISELPEGTKCKCCELYILETSKQRGNA